MVGQEKACSSCGIRLVQSSETTFPCPDCGRGTIGRCTRCRDQSVKYKCTECGFSGP
ncbi:MAG TPA: zinc finger domain-containing protein [Thermoplasmata archaeon]|nr:zinc finger domain-containing protein [Thermoplasmata archaeon]